VLVEVKFLARHRPGVARFRLTAAERAQAKYRPTFFVVPNVEVDLQRLELPPLSDVVTISDLARRTLRGADTFNDDDLE
jgi:hypothetical protein